jgi:ATP-binding cassette subfamily B protein/subfamily B ATP-binding cassette protein MsbA
MILFLSYLGALYAPLETLMYTSSTIQGTAGSVKRVAEIFADRDVVRDRPHARALTKARGAVRFDHVRFGYRMDRPVLTDINLEVHPGETLALVGATGAGKSTLVSLVPRFRDPWEGQVLLDGVDVRDIRLRDLRRQVAMVLQDPFLFRLTIADNIAYGCPTAERTRIQAAAKAAQADRFISRLPQGYDTMVGERGATLSGGERQRIAIARALLLDAPILVLDEPTSALDAETEHDLMAALRQLARDRTTFLIAHRLSTVVHADRVAMLEHGRVVELGTHPELLAAGAAYAAWWRLQAADPPRAPNQPHDDS